MSLSSLKAQLEQFFKGAVGFGACSDDEADRIKSVEEVSFMEFLKTHLSVYEPIKDRLQQTTYQEHELLDLIGRDSEKATIVEEVLPLNWTAESDSVEGKELMDYFRQISEWNKAIRGVCGTENHLSHFIYSQQSHLRLRKIEENAFKFVYYYCSLLETYFSETAVREWRRTVFEGVHQTAKWTGLPIRITHRDMSRLFDGQSTLRAHREAKSNQFYICNQFSLTMQTLRGEGEAKEELRAIVSQLEEIKKELDHSHLDYFEKLLAAREIDYNEKVVSELELLKENQVARAMSRLLRENQSIKKCLSQMMINEAQLTQRNNDAYFEELVESEHSEKDSQLNISVREDPVEDKWAFTLDSLKQAILPDKPDVKQNPPQKKDECIIY